MSSAQDTTAFATRLLELIERTRTNATYKYAVLMGLVDVCQEEFDASGGAPEMVTTRQLAEQVLELYWRQAREHPVHHELLQNQGGQALILNRISDFRAEHAEVPSAYSAKRAYPEDYVRLLNKVEWKLIEAPIPRLQRVSGGVEDEFIYRIHWEVSDVRKQKRASGVSAYQRRFGPDTIGEDIVARSEFDNRIILKPGAGDHLVRLAPLIRPLLRREWTAMVAQLNDLKSDGLERFLFDASRRSIAELAEPLKEAQGGDCFYCGRGMQGTEEVDHFVAWSRHPNDDIYNLVAAHRDCNQDKSHHLAAAEHVRNWLERFKSDRRRQRFDEIASELDIPANRQTSLAIGRSTYLPVPDGTPLWLEGTSEFVPADSDELNRLFQGVRLAGNQ